MGIDPTACHADEIILQRRIIVDFLHNDLAGLASRVDHIETQIPCKLDSLGPVRPITILGSGRDFTLVSMDES